MKKPRKRAHHEDGPFNPSGWDKGIEKRPASWEGPPTKSAPGPGASAKSGAPTLPRKARDSDGPRLF